MIINNSKRSDHLIPSCGRILHPTQPSCKLKKFINKEYIRIQKSHTNFRKVDAASPLSEIINTPERI